MEACKLPRGKKEREGKRRTSYCVAGTLKEDVQRTGTQGRTKRLKKRRVADVVKTSLPRPQRPAGEPKGGRGWQGGTLGRGVARGARERGKGKRHWTSARGFGPFH